MPAFTCSAIRADVKKPSAITTAMKSGTLCSGFQIDGMTWYQRKICTSSGMFRKSSVHALPIHTNALTGGVRRMPISEPTVSATTSEHPETRSVQPHADIIQWKYVWPPPGPWKKTCQSQLNDPSPRYGHCTAKI